MQLPRKLEIAHKAITSISQHEDEDAAVRKAALAELRKRLDSEDEAIDAEVAARLSTLNLEQSPAA